MSESTNIRFTVDGREYTWCGGFGAIIKSKERGVKQGECRVIGDILFFAYTVCYNKDIAWSVPGRTTAEQIREIKQKFLG